MSAPHFVCLLDLKAPAAFAAVDYEVLWDGIRAAVTALNHVANQPRASSNDSCLLAPGGDLVAQLSEDLETLAGRVLKQAQRARGIASATDVERRAWMEIRDAVRDGDLASLGAVVARKAEEVAVARERDAMSRRQGPESRDVDEGPS